MGRGWAQKKGLVVVYSLPIRAFVARVRFLELCRPRGPHPQMFAHVRMYVRVLNVEHTVEDELALAFRKHPLAIPQALCLPAATTELVNHLLTATTGALDVKTEHLEAFIDGHFEPLQD